MYIYFVWIVWVDASHIYARQDESDVIQLVCLKQLFSLFEMSSQKTELKVKPSVKINLYKTNITNFSIVNNTHINDININYYG